MSPEHSYSEFLSSRCEHWSMLKTKVVRLEGKPTEILLHQCHCSQGHSTMLEGKTTFYFGYHALTKAKVSHAQITTPNVVNNIGFVCVHIAQEK